MPNQHARHLHQTWCCTGRHGSPATGRARFLLNRRLGIRLDEGPALLEEREVFDIKGLDRYLLDQDLLGLGYDWRHLFPHPL